MTEPTEYYVVSIAKRGMCKPAGIYTGFDETVAYLEEYFDKAGESEQILQDGIDHYDLRYEFEETDDIGKDRIINRVFRDQLENIIADGEYRLANGNYLYVDALPFNEPIV